MALEIKAANRKSRGCRVLLKIAAGTVFGLVLVEILLQLTGLVITLHLEGTPGKGEGIPILCVGDSHTYGLGVLSPLTYPSRLHALMNAGLERDRYQVISRAVPGRNSASLRERLPGYLKQFRPALVLILAGYNNSWNSADSRHWVEGGPEGGAQVDAFFSRLKLVKLVRLILLNRSHGHSAGGDAIRITTDGDRFFVVEGGEKRPINPGGNSTSGLRSGTELERVTEMDLKACVTLCRSHGARPVLLTYALRGGHFDAVNEAAIRAARATGTLLIDLARAFAPRMADSRERWILPDGTHLNGPGYAAAAETILHVLVEKGLVQLPPGGNVGTGPRPSREDPELSIDIESAGPRDVPVIMVHGVRGVHFQVVLSEKRCDPSGASGTLPYRLPGVGVEMDRLFNLSYMVPSFRGVFGEEPMALHIPSTLAKDFAGRTVFCCLLALDDHARDPAGALLGATPPKAIPFPSREE